MNPPPFYPFPVSILPAWVQLAFALYLTISLTYLDSRIYP